MVFALVKQIACSRRKPGMTRKEYFDYHYQIHGSIVDAVDDIELKPLKYSQTEIFDSAFGPRRDSPPNANHAWFGRDDVTELWFRDIDHLLHFFGSDYVRSKLGPDALKFADLETAIALIAREKSLPLSTNLTAPYGTDLCEDFDDPVMATYFISIPDEGQGGGKLEPYLSPLLAKSLETYASNDVYNLRVNVGIVPEQFNLNSVFGGFGMPEYSLVYKIFLRNHSSVVATRKAQAAFEKVVGDQIDLSESFIVFGKEALVLDVERGIKFTKARQPVFRDL